MTPLQFEQLYEANWNELEAALEQLRDGKKRGQTALAGERFAELYRRCCEQLALARARDYPAHLIDRLDHITTEAHQVIYQRREFGMQRLAELVMRDFPAAVRAHGAYVWIATAVFVLPLAILGALLAQLSRGLINDIYCQIGLVMLIGLSAKNGILIVEFAEQLRGRGMTVMEAAVESARIRFRPILMTSLAFILGVLPLVFATGAGQEARHAVGTSVAGGMVASTILNLAFIPVLYVLFRGRKN